MPPPSPLTSGIRDEQLDQVLRITGRSATSSSDWPPAAGVADDGRAAREPPDDRGGHGSASIRTAS